MKGSIQQIQIIYYRQKCTGCNACVEADSRRWRISKKDGKSVLLKGKEKKGIYFFVTDNEDDFVKSKKAEMNCPMKIIKLEMIKEK